MKPQSITFKKPIKVFQVFRNFNVYKKDEKSFEKRKEKLAWKPIASSSGHINDGIVYLPESIVNHPNFETYDMILMMDDNIPNPQNYFLTEEKVLFFRRKSLNKLDTFIIKFDERIEVHLKYGYFSVGTPERDDFKICELKMNQPVEIKINGKIDFSGSGRRGRSFQEQEYIFDYLGDFIECVLLKEPLSSITKQVPQNRKVVDLNKTLW
jgi:hypothetical protein